MDSAISLINALRKWAVFPSYHEVNEMNDEQLRNLTHKVTDLYITVTVNWLPWFFWILIIVAETTTTSQVVSHNTKISNFVWAQKSPIVKPSYLWEVFLDVFTL